MILYYVKIIFMKYFLRIIVLCIFTVHNNINITFLFFSSGVDTIEKFTPSLGIPYLEVLTPRQELGVKFGNHLSLLSLNS
jgi:hypothetical protein